MDTDFTSHRIEGFTNATGEFMSTPLISQIDENFWQGGCKNNAVLPIDFEHIISLYKWEEYVAPKSLKTMMTITMYDEDKMPNIDQLLGIARWVNVCRKRGKTLVHCQAGLNRSGLVAATALVMEGMMPQDAVNLLRDKRDRVVLCNDTFEKWILNDLKAVLDKSIDSC